jgi:hypothetical protein
MEERERRRFKRIKKTLYLQCHPHETALPWSSVIIQDISEAGMSISSMKKFVVGGVLELKFTTFLQPDPICVLGKVLTCEEKGIGGTRWITRISFTHINEEDKPVLQELIQIFLKTEEGNEMNKKEGAG